MNSPVIIQFSNGGGAAIAGKGISNKNEQAAIAGSIAVRFCSNGLEGFRVAPQAPFAGSMCLSTWNYVLSRLS